MMGGCCGGLGWLGYGSFGNFGWLIGLVFNLLVFGGFIWLVVWAVRRMSAGGGFGPAGLDGSASAAKEILQARYARGEITREEYQQMLDDLNR